MAFEALAMTAAAPVDSSAGKVTKVPPPATALTAAPISPAPNRNKILESVIGEPRLAACATFPRALRQTIRDRGCRRRSTTQREPAAPLPATNARRARDRDPTP